MPFNSRDLWLVLKAQDQTNRALNTFSRNVKNAGDTVAMAQLQAQRAAALGAIAQARLANETQRAAIGSDNARKATIMHTMALKNNEVQTLRAEIANMQVQKTFLNQVAATMKANGASQANIDIVKQQATLLGNEVLKRKMLISQLQMDVSVQQGHANAVQNDINVRRKQVAGNDAYIVQQKQVLAGIDSEIDKLESANRSVQEHEKHMARLSGTLQQASQTATAMGFALTAAGVVAAMGIKQAIDTAVAYERQVRLTATQVDGFTGNLEQLADIGRRLAREIAVPFEQIQPALFDIFSSMEVSTKDAEKLLTQFSKAAVAGQVDIQDVSRATIGLLNAFQRPVSDVNKLLDIQFQLVQEGVGSYEEWNQRIGLVTPSAVRAGQSIEVMMAALAASTRMGMSAARSGTAVARSFDALSNPVAVKNLKALGVAAQDSSGKFRPFNEVLRDFRTVLLKMPEKDRLATILDVFKGAGGTIEARRFLQNILLGAGNLEMFDDILKETSNSAGSMDKAYGLMSEGVAAKTQLLKNQWALLKESVGKSLMPVFAGVVGWLAKMLQGFNDLGPHAKRMAAIVLGLTAVFSLVMGPLLLIIGAVAAVVAAFAVAGTEIAVVVGVLVGLVVGLGGVTTAFLLAWKESENFRSIIKNAAVDVKDLWDILANFAKSVQSNFDTYIMPPLQNLRSYIEDWVLPAFRTFRDEVGDKFVVAMKDVATSLKDDIKPAMETIGRVIETQVKPAVEKLTELWIAHRTEIMQVIGIIITLEGFLLKVAGVIAILAGSGGVLFLINSLMALIAIVMLVISLFGKSIDFFKAVGRAIRGLGDDFRDLKDTAVNAVNLIVAWINSLPGKVVGAIGNLNNLLLDAGRAILNSLIRGMREKLDDLIALASSIANIVTIHKGPLDYDRKLLIPAGKAIMDGLMQGIGDQFPALVNQLDNINGALATVSAPTNTMGSDFGLGTVGAGSVVKNYYITQNITTQEISPIKQAAALGWEVTTVM